MFKLICMSFDGEYQTERPEFETVPRGFDRDDLTEISEEDYCAECGQVGCCANVRAS